MPPDSDDSSALTPPDTIIPRRAALQSDEANIAELRSDVERLLLITEALWGLLRQRLDFDEHALIKEMARLDMEDGRLDGRKPPSSPTPCPNCGRALSKLRPRCVFCGEMALVDPFTR